MAVIEGGVSAALVGVGAESASPMHVVAKPDSYGAFGHYRTSHRAALVANQAANSRLFEFQNTAASNLMVIHAIRFLVIQTGNHTAVLETSFDIFRCTAFSVIDPNNTVTPVASKLRTSMGANASAILRGVTIAGASAGMTGGTLTKDTAPLRQAPILFQATLPTASLNFVEHNFLPLVNSGEHPLVLANNEGFEIENRVVFGAAGVATFYCDVEWSEVTAY